MNTNENENKAMVSANGPQSYRFISKLSSLPLMITIYVCLNRNYIKMKELNVFVKQSFSLVELVLLGGMQGLSQLLGKFGRQFDRLDLLACALLESLERKFPIINKNTNIILDELTRPVLKLASKLPFLDRCLRSLDALKTHTSHTLLNKFQLTKDKLDLYKEYLDVLTKQFMVQDGRSLEHVHSLEERTKIIIRRSIGNLLKLIQIMSSKLSSLFDLVAIKNTAESAKTVVVAYAKGSLRRLEQMLVKLMLLQSLMIVWLVPNFDSFGVLNELDDDDTDTGFRETLVRKNGYYVDFEKRMRLYEAGRSN